MIESVSNPELKRDFERDGFVFLPQFVSGEGLADLLAHLDRFISDIVPQLYPEQVFYEDKSNPATLKQIQRMGDHDPWFAALFTSSRFRKIAELLLDGPVVPKNMQYFNKPPGVGQPTPPHQDGYYFMLDPCEAVTMWLALDNVDENNGCVRYVHGSQNAECGCTRGRKHSVSVRASWITPRIKTVRTRSRFRHNPVTCWFMQP